jgi:heat shock protein HslJ
MDELQLVREYFGEHPPPAPETVAAAKSRLALGQQDRRLPHLPRLHRRVVAPVAGMTRRDRALCRNPLVRGTRRWLLPLASAAGVMMIVLATAFIGHLYSNPATRGTTAYGTAPAATAGFAGYKWTVVTIGHDGKTTPVPARYSVYLQFTPDGHFGANDPVNFHSGRYEVTPGGFTTSELASTLAGYAGSDPVVLLAEDAISAFDAGKRALTRINGDILSITVNGYILIAQRDGTQANWPVPKQT